ncbi:hypothetical protein [uncultured Thiodictyon sp.]|uniref:hypothetical protein n=1 Tax=uncultured Thiodictyon sp. TaxID=1846217 RepID=UPI0025F419D6|nr:hypothetical protein [uncultured Thiodictyon sp.]
MSFRPRWRARAFGWRGSSLAIQRLKEAVAEIKAVHRSAPARAAEGAILLLERLWPALQPISAAPRPASPACSPPGVTRNSWT